jgi:hypothetical protein
MSRFIQRQIKPPAGLDHDSYRILTGALLFVKKICQRAALFWFGLQDIGILYSQAVIQRTIVDFQAFLEYVSAEKI